jgi:hypothetical protein
MKSKRRYQRNKKLGLKISNDIHEIKLCNNESKEILLCLLNKFGIVYFDQIKDENIFIINIYGNDIDKIYEILLNELTGNGIDTVTGCLNDYGRRIDNLCGIFGLIKGEKDKLEKINKTIFRSRKLVKYNKNNKI